MWEDFLIGIAAGVKVGTPLDCWLGKLLCFPIGFNICNTVFIVLGIFDGFFLGFALGKKLDNQEFLDGDCFGFFVIFPCGIWLGSQMGVQMHDKFMTYIMLVCSDRGYYPPFVGIIRISWILWVYPHLNNIICVGHIKSYLVWNVRPIFHIYSSIVSEWCITYFPFCNLICFSIPSYFWLVHFVSEYNWVLTLSRYMCLHIPLQSKLVFIHD